jgi:hypothetical protein
MKAIFGVLSLALIVISFVDAYNQGLPEVTLPKVDYAPVVKKGWVGQYVYQVKFEGKSSLKPTRFEHSYNFRIDRVHTGFVELTSEVRAAIRTNQPDRNNAERWESWIPIGTKKSWSLVDEFIRTATSAYPSLSLAATDKYSTLVQIERNIGYDSGGSWVQGRTHYADLQIDHVAGKFSFAVPKVEYSLDGEEWGIKVAADAKSTEEYRRPLKTAHTHQGSMIHKPIDWDIIGGDFSKDQREIVFRQRIPLKFEPEAFEERGKSYRLTASNGFLDFYLVLRRIG